MGTTKTITLRLTSTRQRSIRSISSSGDINCWLVLCILLVFFLNTRYGVFVNDDRSILQNNEPHTSSVIPAKARIYSKNNLEEWIPYKNTRE